jgi:WD40 repeat protein
VTEHATAQQLPESIAQVGHADFVRAVSVSTDGRWVASVGTDRTLRLWQLPSRRLARVVRDVNAQAICILAGTEAIVAAGETVLVVATDGESRMTIPVRNVNQVPLLACSADRRLFATRNDDDRLFVYGLDRKALPQFERLPPHRRPMFAMALNADGTRLAVGVGQQVLIYDVANATVVATISGPISSVATSIAFAGTDHVAVGYHDPDGARLDNGAVVYSLSKQAVTHTFPRGNATVAVGQNGTLVGALYKSERLFLADVSTGAAPVEIAQDIPINANVFVTDPLVFGADDGVVFAGERLQAFETTTRAEIARRSAVWRVTSAAPSPDGKYVIAGMFDGALRKLSTDPGGASRRLGGVSPIDAIVFDAEGQRLLAATRDGRTTGDWVSDWSIASGTVSVSGPISGPGALAAAAGVRALGDGNGVLHVLSRGDQSAFAEWKAHEGSITATALTPDGRFAVSAGTDGFLKVWNVASRAQIKVLQSARTRIHRLVIVNDRLLAAAWDGAVDVWDTANWRHLKTIRGAAFAWDFPIGSSEGTNATLAIAVRSLDDQPKVLTNFSGQGPLDELHTGFLTSLARFDGTSAPGWVRLFDARDWKEGKPLRVADGRVESLAFAPGGEMLAVGSSDTKVHLWDLRNRLEVRVLAGHTDTVTGLAFIEPRRLLTSSADGSIRIWDVASGDVLLSIIPNPDEASALSITPDGFFDGNAGSLDLVGWRVERSNDTVGLDSFFNDFYRPGLLREVLRGGRPRAELDIALLAQVPGLRRLLADKLAHYEVRGLDVAVCFSEEPGAAANLPVGDQRAFVTSLNGYTVDKADATCQFRKVIGPATPELLSHIARLERQPPTPTIPSDASVSTTRASTLHVMTVAVSRYQDELLGELPYAAATGKAVEQFFRQGQRAATGTYAAVRVWDGLYDGSATKRSVEDRVREMAKGMLPDDVAIVYLGGHGAVSNEMFYFLPADARTAELHDTAVSTARLADFLRWLPARRIVFIMDACQSGAASEALEKVVLAKADAARSANTARDAGADGLGVHIATATLPISYAVGGKSGVSALGEVLLDALQDGRNATIGQVLQFVKDKLPEVSERTTGFRQVPLVRSIGRDFGVSPR